MKRFEYIDSIHFCRVNIDSITEVNLQTNNSVENSTKTIFQTKTKTNIRKKGNHILESERKQQSALM